MSFLKYSYIILFLLLFSRVQMVNRLQEATGFPEGGYFSWNIYKQMADLFEKIIKYDILSTSRSNISLNASALVKQHATISIPVTVPQNSIENTNVKYGTTTSSTSISDTNIPATSTTATIPSETIPPPTVPMIASIPMNISLPSGFLPPCFYANSITVSNENQKKDPLDDIPIP
jgi:hypothetical protein